jgi:hypothetical protein
MGMTGGICRASDSQIRELRHDPAKLATFLEGSAWMPPLRDVRPRGLLGWLLKWSPITVQEVDPEAVPPPGYDSPALDDVQLDIDKAWHGLHFLFTGTAWEGEEPASYLVRGGEDIGEADELGYSSIRALTADQVSRFAAFLKERSREELRQRYDPKRMMALEIYPETWTRDTPGAESELEILLASFEELRDFVSRAAASGDCAIVYLT